MPFLFIYSPDDFVGGLPDESGAMAAGTAPFTLTLKPGAKPTLVEVTDDDPIFDEVDTQTLTNAVTIDGTPYAAGDTVTSAYDLINTGTGHKVTILHFNVPGTTQGPVDGLVSTEPLTGGQSYTFDQERTSHQKTNPYQDYVACFGHGTPILTEAGPKPVQALRIGDRVVTRDAGLQPLVWVGGTEVEATGSFAPIVFASGAIGNARSLVLSPEHRVLHRSGVYDLMFGECEVLMAAKHFVNGRDVMRREGGRVRYHHVMCADHQVIFAEGVPCESLLPGPGGLDGLDRDARAELLTLFPGLAQRRARPVRRVLQGFETRALAGIARVNHIGT